MSGLWSSPNHTPIYHRWSIEKSNMCMPPSSPDHTKLSVWFQLWNFWGLCSDLDVGPHFLHYYSRRCQRMVSQLAGVINPSLLACGRTHPCCRRLRSLSIRHLSILCSSMLYSSICYMPAQAAHIPVHLMESMRVFNWWLCYVWIMNLLLFCSTPLMPYTLSNKTKSACWVFLQRWAHTMFKDSSLWAFN